MTLSSSIRCSVHKIPTRHPDRWQFRLICLTLGRMPRLHISHFEKNCNTGRCSWSQVKTKSHKLKTNARNEILQGTLHTTHILKLLGKMHKYEMDPTRTVGATERTCDAGRTRDLRGPAGRPDGQTDWRSETNVTPPPPPQLPTTTSLYGGYNKLHIYPLLSNNWSQLSKCWDFPRMGWYFAWWCYRCYALFTQKPRPFCHPVFFTLLVKIVSFDNFDYLKKRCIS